MVTLTGLTEALRRAGIEEAPAEARLLFAHYTGARMAALYGENPASDSPALAEAAERRLTREPLAYILGEAPFWRQTYRIGPGCLIPRTDTETLVEQAIALLPLGAHFADLCTGSGCIAVSVLCDRPDTAALGADISAAALAFAAKNASRYRVGERLTLWQSDLLQEEPYGIFDAILANPPYIAAPVLRTLAPEVRREPREALDGGEDGLLFYRRFLSFRHCLTPDGFFLFECGFDQREALAALAADAGLTFTPHFDCGGNFRVCLLRPR